MSRGAIEGHPQDVTARSRQVHVSRIANSPFRVVSAGSASRRALPSADGSRAIPQSETIALTVGKSPRRVTIGGFAPRPVAWQRPAFSLPLDAHDASLLDVSGGSRPAGASRVRLGRCRQPPGCGPLCGWPGHASQHPPFCRDGPVNTASARGQSRARSQATTASAAASAAPRIRPCVMPGHPFPRQRGSSGIPIQSRESAQCERIGQVLPQPASGVTRTGYTR